ncbi:RDD family protein [Nonomuraea soli]|nr:RDD family protein [Nonomuraea soli]
MAPLAGRWRRLFAGILDMIIVSIVSSPFGWTSYQEVWNSNLEIWERVPVEHVIPMSIIGFLYFWLLHSFWNGQTVGKKVFGMRVVAVDGSKASVGQIAVRELVRELMSWLCCVGTLIDLGFILFDDRKQAVHDKAGKTLVVDA